MGNIRRNHAPQSIYGTNVFLRHIPANVQASGGEGQISIIAADHLTSMDMNSWQGSGGSYSVYDSAVNIDLKGPGHTIHSMGIYVNTGEAVTPQPINAPGWPFQSGTAIYVDGCMLTICAAQLGGLVRAGELLNGIPHALRFAADPTTWNSAKYRWGVWPAENGDGNGTSGNLYQGGLVALPPSFNVNALATPQGKNVARALQNYGAYAGGSGSIGVGVLEFYMDGQAGSDIPSSAVFQADLNTIASALMVVANSHHNGSPPVGGNKLDGGDGTLRAPLAPPFDR